MALKNKGLLSLRFIRAAVFAAVVALAALCAPQDARAQATACDPEYMDALEARAWLEMQRELLQNQNLIAKPDSVLEYSCFTNDLWRLVNYNQPGGDPNTWLFSEGGCCNTPNTNPVALDTVVGGIVRNAAAEWIRGHFWFSQNNNDALGGRSSGTTGLDGWEPNRDYLCSNMSGIWDDAHCSYFSNSNQADGFYDFEWYMNNDPRTLPNIPGGRKGGAYCPTREPGLSERVLNMFGGGENPPRYNQQHVAFNNNQSKYVISENPEGGSITIPTHRDPYKQDLVRTHLDLILPIGVAPAPTSCSSVTPIPTGVCVTRVKGGSQIQYADAVCPNPGCHYVARPGSCSSIGQCQ